MSFSPDGSLLAVEMLDRGVALFQVAGGQPIGVLSRGQAGLWRFAFSPDGTRLAVAVAGAIHMWSLDTVDPVQERSRITTLSGQQLMSELGRDFGLRLWKGRMVDVGHQDSLLVQSDQ